MLFYLVGMPSCGKSTLGKILANNFNFDFIDLDTEIEKSEKCTISEIFEQKGEDYFRIIEKNRLTETFAISKDTIISCGGGIPCFYDNIDAINCFGISIYIKTSPEILFKRLSESKNGITNRPLINQDTELLELLRTKTLNREKFYNKSKFTVNTDNSAIHESVEELMTIIKTCL